MLGSDDFDLTNFGYFLYGNKLYFFSINSFHKFTKRFLTNLSKIDIDSLIASSDEVNGIEAIQIEQAISADLPSQIQTNKNFLYTLPIPVLYRILNDYPKYHSVDQNTLSFLFEYLDSHSQGYMLFDFLRLQAEKGMQLLYHYLSSKQNYILTQFLQKEDKTETEISGLLDQIIEFYKMLSIQWKIYQNLDFKQIPPVDIEKLKCVAHNLLMNDKIDKEIWKKIELIDSLFIQNQKEMESAIASQKQKNIDEWLQTLQFPHPKPEKSKPTRVDFIKEIIDSEKTNFFLTRQGELSLIKKSYIKGQFERNRFINPFLTIYAVLQNKPNVLQTILNKQIKLRFLPNEILFPTASDTKINLFHLSIEKNDDCFKVIYRILSDNSSYFSFPEIFDWFTPTSYYTAIFYFNQDAISYLQGFSNPFLIKDNYLDPFRLAVLRGNKEEVQYILQNKAVYQESWEQLQQKKFDPIDLSVSENKNSQTIKDILKARHYIIDELAPTKTVYSNTTFTYVEIFNLEPKIKKKKKMPI